MQVYVCSAGPRSGPDSGRRCMQRALLLVWLTAHAACAAAAQQPVAFVATADQLHRALAAPARHIVVTAHLRLDGDSNADPARFAAVTAATQSIRVRRLCAAGSRGPGNPALCQPHSFWVTMGKNTGNPHGAYSRWTRVPRSSDASCAIKARSCTSALWLRADKSDARLRRANAPKQRPGRHHSGWTQSSASSASQAGPRWTCRKAVTPASPTSRLWQQTCQTRALSRSPCCD